MQHFLTLIIFCLLSLLCFGCDSQVQPPLEKIQLTLWESYNNEEHHVFLELLAPFCQAYQERTGKHLEIKIFRVSHDGLLPKLKTAALSHTTPDICRVDFAHVITLAYGKAILPLDTLQNFPQPLSTYRQNFLSVAIESNLITLENESTGTAETHLYGLPDQTTCVALFWNKTRFEEKAIPLRHAKLDPTRAPKTWEEFLAYGKILSTPEKQQFAFGLRNTLWWHFPFFQSFGASFLFLDSTQRWRCGLNQKSGQEALHFIRDLCQREYDVDGKKIRIEGGAWQSGGINPDQGFMNGLYAMIFSGPWNLKTFRDAGVSFGVSLIPAGSVGSSSTVGGTNFVVFRSCAFPEVAFDVLQYITSEHFQKQWCERLGQIPTRKGIVIEYHDYPEMQVFYEQMQQSRNRPPIPRYDLVEQLVNPEIELVLKGIQSPEKALETAVSKIENQILSLIQK